MSDLDTIHVGVGGKVVDEAEAKAIAAEKASNLNGFKVANLLDNTNFTIKLGSHSWRVQTKVITKVSRFFAAACNGNFKESTTREVELHDDSPWDIARLLQFIYLGRFDHNIDGDLGASALSIRTLVTQSNYPDEDDIFLEANREPIDTWKAMWLIANKYGIPSMWQHTGVLLMDKLEILLWQELRDDFMNVYLATFDLTQEAYHVDAAGEDLEDRMISVLLRFKLKFYSQPWKAGINVVSNADGGTDLEIRRFKDNIIERMDQNGRFARKVAQGMENMVNKSLYFFTWSDRRLERLRSTGDSSGLAERI